MKIITAIVSTTHVDAHHERMIKKTLDSVAKQIRARFISCLIGCDSDQRTRVILYGKVKRLEDGEFTLFIVVGIFDDEKEYKSYAIGSKNTVWRKYSSDMDDVVENTKRQKTRGKNRYHEANTDVSTSITDLLGIHLDSTVILINGRAYTFKYLIASVYDLTINVYPKDHLPAHFHVVSRQRGIDARFDINTLELINAKKGLIKARDVKKIKDFFQNRPEMLKKMRNKHAGMQ